MSTTCALETPLRAVVQCAIASALLLTHDAEARERSAAAVREFKRQSPCPATGQPRGACPGWIVDHVVPLCAGGADRPSNMQWQTVAAAKVKDRDERKTCHSSGNLESK